MIGKQSFIIGDVMGLAKTLQVLTAAAHDFKHGRASRLLVVTPKNLKGNFAGEIQRWTHFTWETLDGDPKRRQRILDGFDSEVLITHYEQIKGHYEQLNGMGFDIVIADEVHKIKNWGAAHTKAFHKLTPRRFMLMSGSFIQNRPDEAWSPLRLCLPEMPSYFSWTHKYCSFTQIRIRDKKAEARARREDPTDIEPRFRRGKQLSGVKPHKLDEFRESISSVFLRRTWDDVELELPPLQHTRINVALSPYQAKLYDAIVNELRDELPPTPDDFQVEEGVQKTLRLQQVCATPANIEGWKDDSSKLDVCMDHLTDLTGDGHKVVVFCRFRGTLDCLQKRIEDKGMVVYTHHGGKTLRARDTAVSGWKSHEGPAVFLAMLQTAGDGLTLVEARHTIMVEKLYGPTQMEQAECRTYRIGADPDHPVQVIELIAEGTYEEKIEAILDRKGQMISEIVPNSGWKKKVYEAVLEGRTK